MQHIIASELLGSIAHTKDNTEAVTRRCSISQNLHSIDGLALPALL